MGQTNSKQKKYYNNSESEIFDDLNIDNYKEKSLFSSFQEKKINTQITCITYFQFNPKNIKFNPIKSEKTNNLEDSNTNNLSSISNSSSNPRKHHHNHKKRKKSENSFESLKNELFLFIYTIENAIHVIDSYKFEKTLKFREEDKSLPSCELMFQSKDNDSLLICIHGKKININKLKLIANFDSMNINFDLVLYFLCLSQQLYINHYYLDISNLDNLQHLYFHF